jgi:hypothetical protein
MSIVVLNANCQYWCDAELRRVAKWLIKNKAEVMESDDDRIVGGLGISFPLVVRLFDFIGYRAKSETIPFNENAVYWRDDNVCQYWHHDADGRRFKYRCSVSQRTIDHVVPRSMGGAKSFENCVCACQECNIKIKKNRRPEEAGLELIRKPAVPLRRRGEMIIGRFVFDPNKISHRVYVQKILGRSASVVEPQILESAMAA